MERVTYTLIVHPEDLPVLRLALRILRDDLGHEEHDVRAIAGEVADQVAADDVREVHLDAPEMKVAWSALHAMLDDTRRDEEGTRQVIRDLLHRLPGEHDIRAIDLDSELARRQAS